MLGQAVFVAPARASKNDPVPPEQLVGKWKDAKGVVVTIDHDEKGEFTLIRHGVTWEQVGAYRPGPYSSLTFKHKPSADELPDDMPSEIRSAAVADNLEWRIRFTDIETGYRALGNGCRLFLKGEFLPGDVKWDTIVDKDSGSKTNVFKSAKVGGPPKKIEIKQIQHELPDMGQWLEINMHLDATSAAAGLGEVATIPTEAQSYTYLGNLDAAILEGMYNGLTLNVPLEGVGKYAIKLFKGLAKKKLEGASNGGAIVDTIGKMVGAEILKGLLPKNAVPEDIKPLADKIIDKVAGELTKQGVGAGEKLFSGVEDTLLKQYLTDKCRFKFVELPLYTNKAVSLGLAIVDLKAGTAHIVFVAPPRKLKTGGEYQGALLTGDISLPEEGQKPKKTILNLTLTPIPQ